MRSSYRGCQRNWRNRDSENHNIINGLGSAVAEVVNGRMPSSVERVGVKDEYGEVGEVEYLAERFGLTAKYIVEAAKKQSQKINRR